MERALAPGSVVAPARVRYLNDQPYSLDYEDIYHAADGDAEVRRVFLEPCGLEALARQHGARGDGPRNLLRVGELGFGSGYNFVLAAETCLAAGARLHFVSFEASPIDAGDFAAIAAHRAPAHPLYRELAAAYPPRIRGWHRRYLAGGRISLSLWWGDAESGLADMSGRQRQPLDAWFLDGFAPDRNPELWQPALFEHLAALSTRGTRVATFTAAGRVRRGLMAAGFAMRRVDQRPHKRESLAGTFERPGLAGFAPPAEVLVAGGGLAGASAAWHLARAGCRLRVLEPEEAAHPPASAIPATVLHGRLLADGSDRAALRALAYLYAADLLRDLPGFRGGGVLQLGGGTQDDAKLRRLEDCYRPAGEWLRWLDGDEATALAGWPVATGGLYFPAGGVVDLPALVRGLLARPEIDVRRERLSAIPSDVPVVLACGAATRDLPPARYLELAPVQGQLDVVELAPVPKLPLVGRGYLVPEGRGVAAGATYEHRPWDPAEASRANLAQLEGLPYVWRGRHRGTRTVSSDRTPVAGRLYDPEGSPYPELYVSTGHGSQGNVGAHIGAAVVAALITGDCPPLPRELEATLSPLRFRERQARRGYRHGATP